MIASTAQMDFLFESIESKEDECHKFEGTNQQVDFETCSTSSDVAISNYQSIMKVSSITPKQEDQVKRIQNALR